MRFPHDLSASFYSALCAFALILCPLTAQAQGNPYAPGWELDASNSYIRFGSIKYEKGAEVVETHSFATFSGEIEPDGKAEIDVKLDSVDTNNDLRNVRMRFLFFETFKFPEAKVTAQLTSEMAAGMAAGKRMSTSVPFTLAIHGTSGQMTADVTVVAETNDRIVVSSTLPVIFRVAEFGLQNNLTKIAETAGGFDIVPNMTLTFQLAFDRVGGAAAPAVAAPKAEEKEEPAVVALETQGEFSVEECVGRFEILSETGNIYFASGSARLQPDSAFVLATITDIIKRCPQLDILISGHTDSDGSADYNQTLSERRAAAVQLYLRQQGIPGARLATTGFGESRPFVANDTPFNKSRNRRIEFSLLP